ncbi:hypothetical protein M3147_16375 [Agromyces mediolanus]|uniref:hypothetical protein n=1 Tax=Agromyces mediolanus TaxID=41986 RepID=UPI00203CDA5F|nr:hypothetical protein [Agromyces mediolanus]MCM3658834.1 hypothetical protein [Agromyces mediolanus]
MRKKIAALMTASLLGAGLVVGAGAPSAAEAASVEPTPAQEADLRNLFTRFSVPMSQQDSLIESASEGTPWDVYDATEAPATEETAVIDGVRYTIRRYADGSFTASGMEIPTVPTSVQPQGISQCSYSTGSGYSNATGCQIDGVWGSVILGPTNVNYTLVQGGPDRITKSGIGFQRCVWPTSCSTPTLVYSSLTEGTFLAQIMWQGDVTASWGSWNAWVRLFVGNDTAYTTTS